MFTPHARGSTLPALIALPMVIVYPACAGIDPLGVDTEELRTRLPRMRGDRPRLSEIRAQMEEFTPHARGSTLPALIALPMVIVYPACAGIDPLGVDTEELRTRLPRMRGDRPPSFTFLSLRKQFTPHARGSTLIEEPPAKTIFVYPACAGIDLDRRRVWRKAEGLPRMRGDRPPILFSRSWIRRFTPHARGSTRSQPMPE